MQHTKKIIRDRMENKQLIWSDVNILVLSHRNCVNSCVYNIRLESGNTTDNWGPC